MTLIQGFLRLNGGRAYTYMVQGAATGRGLGGIMSGEVVLRRVLVVLKEDGTLIRVVAVDLEGPIGRATYWRLGVTEEEMREARAIPPEDL